MSYNASAKDASGRKQEDEDVLDDRHVQDFAFCRLLLFRL